LSKGPKRTGKEAAEVGSRNDRNIGDTKMSANEAVRKRVLGSDVEFQAEVRAVSAVRHPSDDEVRLRAFEIHVERGGLHGYDLDDWLDAEKELTQALQR
jgi:hypothetical protein